jgi:hypothetical protein
MIRGRPKPGGAASWGFANSNRHKPQAIAALDRLTQEFPDKDKLLEIVEQRMPQVLDEIVQQIERNYFQEVDRSELIETAIRAIVGKLDGRGLVSDNDPSSWHERNG